jgi:hypothetical protein
MPFHPKKQDQDAILWRNAVVAAGGIVGGSQFNNIQILIRTLKTCGAWALTDDYAVYATADNSPTQALVTLKKRVTQTLAHVTSTNPTFVANRGFLGNVDGYINTGWNPSTGPLYTQNNARLGAWAYQLGTVSNYSLMGNEDSNTNQALITTTGPVYRYGVNTAGLPNSSTITTGLAAFFRSGANAEGMYLNGAANGTDTSASIAMTSRNLYVLATNNGTVAHAGNFGVSAAMYGADLGSASVYAAEYAAFRAYMTSVGVP